jgi:hypothetical protein
MMEYKEQIKSTVNELQTKAKEIYRSYSPKIKRETTLFIHKTITSIKYYTPIVKDCIVKYAKIYGRKTREAYIAFRKS